MPMIILRKNILSYGENTSGLTELTSIMALKYSKMESNYSIVLWVGSKGAGCYYCDGAGTGGGGD